MMSPSLADLDAFVAVARARGFRGAAASRGASASGLSEAVRRLEGALGVRLLNRTTRSVTPTEAGERLLERLGPALGEIESGLDVVNSFRDNPRGALKLNVPVIVAMKVLPPIVSRFLAAYPGVRLEIVASDDFIDVVGAGFDAGIRYEERIERDMIAVPMDRHPALRRRCGAVLSRRPRDPRPSTRTRRPRLHPPPVCERRRRRLGVRARRRGRADQAGRAARRLGDRTRAWRSDCGPGDRLHFEEFLREALDRGELTEVLADWRQSFSGPFLYYPSRNMPAPLRAFVGFIRGAL